MVRSVHPSLSDSWAFCYVPVTHYSAQANLNPIYLDSIYTNFGATSTTFLLSDFLIYLCERRQATQKVIGHNNNSNNNNNNNNNYYYYYYYYYYFIIVIIIIIIFLPSVLRSPGSLKINYEIQRWVRSSVRAVTGWQTVVQQNSIEALHQNRNPLIIIIIVCVTCSVTQPELVSWA